MDERIDVTTSSLLVGSPLSVANDCTNGRFGQYSGTVSGATRDSKESAISGRKFALPVNLKTV